MDVFLSCCALWFALRSHGVTGTVKQQQQPRACYRASMLCFHGYATAAWGDAELTRRSLVMPRFIPFISFFHAHIRHEHEIKPFISKGKRSAKRENLSLESRDYTYFFPVQSVFLKINVKVCRKASPALQWSRCLIDQHIFSCII